MQNQILFFLSEKAAQFFCCNASIDLRSRTKCACFSSCAQGRRNWGGKGGNCAPKFWKESQQMCSRPLELGRKGGQLRPQILARIAANVLKAVGTRKERGGNCAPEFWQESQQMCSRPSELGRKGGQLRPQILARIAAKRFPSKDPGYY